MFKFRQKRTSFHNVRVDSGSYLDMEVSATGSINSDMKLLNNNREIIKPQKSSSSSFSSPFLETTWTSLNIVLFIIYMIFQTIIPFYLSITDQIFNYPLTSMCIQLSISIILLFIYNIIKFHCCFMYHPIASSPTSSLNNRINSNLGSWANLFMSQQNNPSDNNNDDSNSNASNIILRTNFCKHFFGKFWLKWKLIIFPSAFFALNMMVSKIGISQGSMDIHILLSATEMVWFVILSPFLLTDYPTKSAVLSCVILTIGAICFSWTDIKQNDMTFTIIFCNLLSAIFKPFQILFLRRATRILTMEESETRKMDRIDIMSKSEMTLFYLIWGLLILLPFQLIFEGIYSWNNINKQFGADCNWTLIIIGSILLLFYELNIVSLISNVEPILIGIGQQSEELWRFIMSMFLGGITLKICDCIISNDVDGDQCDDDIDNRYPICPCWKQPEDIFSDNDLILHWFGLLFITLGLIFYCYLKAKNTHVTNVNIFRFGN